MSRLLVLSLAASDNIAWVGNMIVKTSSKTTSYRMLIQNKRHLIVARTHTTKAHTVHKVPEIYNNQCVIWF